jgi:hypothetical protein
MALIACCSTNQTIYIIDIESTYSRDDDKNEEEGDYACDSVQYRPEEGHG